MKKAVIIHLWEGYPEYCWYQNTKIELEQFGFIVDVPQMPEPNLPKMDRWVSTLRDIIKKPSDDVYLIGHSIGAVTILRYLESLTNSERVGGVVLVAGFTDDMGYEVFSNFFAQPLRFEKIKNKAKNFTVIISNDDPYVDIKYGYELSEKLDGELIIKKGMKHMSKDCRSLPDVAIAIRKHVMKMNKKKGVNVVLTVPKSKDDAYKLMSDIMKGLYSTNELVRFLLASEASSLSRSALRGYLGAICDSAIYRLDTKSFNKPIVDIVGTGGDGKHTANISTLAALICAATGLVSVAKYGNRSASGICGSMDLLEGLGIDIDLPEKRVINLLKNVGFAPLYARSIYPGGKFVAEARKQVGRPTMFNLLFPLARPLLGDQNFVFGCATQSQMNIVEKIYTKDKSVRCVIVRGLDQTDEISISGFGKTRYCLIDQGRVKHGLLNCQIFEISLVDLKYLQITTKDEAVELFKAALDPRRKGKRIQAIRNAGVVNAAVALFIALDKNKTDIALASKYFSVAYDALYSGKAQELVRSLKSMKG